MKVASVVKYTFNTSVINIYFFILFFYGATKNQDSFFKGLGAQTLKQLSQKYNCRLDTTNYLKKPKRIKDLIVSVPTCSFYHFGWMIGRINVKSKQKCLLKVVLSPLYSKNILLLWSYAAVSISVGNFCVLIIVSHSFISLIPVLKSLHPVLGIWNIFFHLKRNMRVEL